MTRPRNEGGQATVELALCLPFVVLLLAAVVEVGVLGSHHVRLWHAAREAARTAAVEADEDEVRRSARASGLGSLEVGISPDSAGRRYGEPVTVRLVHRYRGHVPLVGKLFESVALRAATTMRIEQP